MTRATTTVLHVRIVSGAGGGPEKTILNSPRFMRESRYQALALYLHAPGDPGIHELARRADRAGCPFQALPDPRPVDFATLEKVARVCREHDVRIWHGHDYKSNLFGVLLERLCDVKLFSTVHGWVKHTEKTPLYFAVDRFALRRYHEVVAVSQDLYDACLATGVARERLTLIENAIDTEEFRRRGPPSESPLRADPVVGPSTIGPSEHARPSSRLVVGAIGRLSEEKGFHYLIEAVERAVDLGCDLELWIAGEGDQKESLARQIAGSRHAARIKLLGYVKEPRELFEALDIFVLSSLREGLPNVVLEAMAMEVPVLSTTAGGMGAFARDGEDALLIAPGSVDELCGGLIAFARDPDLRTRLATNARERIEQEYTFEHRMRRELELYDRLMGVA